MKSFSRFIKATALSVFFSGWLLAQTQCPPVRVPQATAIAYDMGLLGVGTTSNPGTYRWTNGRWNLVGTQPPPVIPDGQTKFSATFSGDAYLFDLGLRSCWRWTQGAGLGTWAVVYQNGGGLPAGATGGCMVAVEGQRWPGVLLHLASGVTYSFNGAAWAQRATGPASGVGGMCYDSYLDTVFMVCPQGVFELNPIYGAWHRWTSAVPGQGALLYQCVMCCSHDWVPVANYPGGPTPQLVVPEVVISASSDSVWTWRWDPYYSWVRTVGAGGNLWAEFILGYSRWVMAPGRPEERLSVNRGSFRRATVDRVGTLWSGSGPYDPWSCTARVSSNIHSSPEGIGLMHCGRLSGQWFATSLRGPRVYSFDVASAAYSTPGTPSLAGFVNGPGVDGGIRQMCEIGTGRLMGVYRGEWAQYNAASNQWTALSQQPPTGAPIVGQPVWDPTSGMVYVGRADGSIMQYDGGGWSLVPESLPMPLSSYSLFVREGLLWCVGSDVWVNGYVLCRSPMPQGGFQWVVSQPWFVPSATATFLGGFSYDAYGDQLYMTDGLQVYAMGKQQGVFPSFWVQRPQLESVRRQGVSVVAGSSLLMLVDGAGGMSMARLPDCAGQVDSLGNGCSANAVLLGGVPPIAGTVFTPKVVASAQSPWAALFYGVSVTNWAGNPLPYDLAGVGLAATAIGACLLRTSPDIVQIGLALPSGEVVGALSIPAGVSMVGLELGVQALVPEAGSNPAGLVVTEAIRCRVGEHW